MPGYRIGDQRSLCDTASREYVAGHNKLLLITGVLGAALPAVDTRNPR